MDMIAQVNNALSTLKKYGFCHADLKGQNVFVSSGDVKPIYKIADYDKSSITYRGFRFYNSDYQGALPYYIPFEVVDGYYKITGSGVSILPLQIYTMHNPYGFYLSYDYYTLICSPMSIDNVWNFFINNPDSRFSKLFVEMWKPDEYNKLLEYLKKYRHNLERLGQVNSMFVYLNLSLRYDFGFIPIEEKYITVNNFLETRNNQICQNDCNLNPNYSKYYKTCNTNKYKKTYTIYDWDYC